jgi:hypothetical protein
MYALKRSSSLTLSTYINMIDECICRLSVRLVNNFLVVFSSKPPTAAFLSIRHFSCLVLYTSIIDGCLVN